MREIKYIVIHCTDTLPTAKVESIQKYWKNKLGWKSPGYHYIIKQDGEVVQLLDESKISNGVLGFNKESINLSYIGGRSKEGKNKDTRTKSQQHSMFDLIIELTERYPKAIIKGHGEFPNQGGRTCPNFNVKKWLEEYTPDIDLAA